MAFPEQLKRDIKRRSHFACCLCHGLGVEVHHIVPQAEDGPDTDDNAAPLCPSCHETYGANPTKRKLVRESRDLWYEICAKRYASDPDQLELISDLLHGAATKADLSRAVDQLTTLIREAAYPSASPSQSARNLTQATSFIASGVGVNRMCKRCGTAIGLFVGDQGKCPTCGAPW
jgi:hypothetical protein